MPTLVKWSRRAGILIAMPVDRIDGSNAQEYQNILESGIDPAEGALILDFTRLRYISSAGLGLCLTIGRKFTGPGKAFGICNPSRSVRGLLTLSGFDQIISIYESQGAAVEAIAGVTGAESARGQPGCSTPSP